MECLLVQPIHPEGVKILECAGLRVRLASQATMPCVVEEIGSAVAAITRNAGFNRAAMDAGARLQVIGNHGSGFDPVDLAHAARIGLPIVYTPGANVQSVAEHAIAQMMAIAKRTLEADGAVREDRFHYRYQGDFIELSGKTLLIVGFGAVGHRTARMAAAAFDMRVLVHSPNADPAAISRAGFLHAPDLFSALGQADIVSLHQRLHARTRHLFNADAFAAMKRGAMLVNTARGGLVATDALVDAVSSGQLRGAAMDVFDTEPLPSYHPFQGEPRIILSPHIAGATDEALARTAVDTANQVVAVLNGTKPSHLVDDAVWTRRRRPA